MMLWVTLEPGGSPGVLPRSSSSAQVLELPEVESLARPAGVAPSWVNITSTLADSPSAMNGQMATYDLATNYTLLFGGFTVHHSLNASWRFAGTTWTPIPTNGSIPGLNLGAMAYDSFDRYVVQFGGNMGPPVSSNTGETWVYIAGSWVEILPPAAPAGRANEVMTYDAADNSIVLFSGCGPANTNGTCALYTDTWEFRGGLWSRLAPPTSPPGRDSGSMVYDPAIGAAVLFGGCSPVTPPNTCAGVLNDTWEFRAGTWTEIHTPVSPPGRWQASFAFDANLGYPVLFGGQALDGSFLSDTWEFTGTTWLPLHFNTSPPARARASLVFDLQTGEDVLFGGLDAAGNLGDTWALRSPVTPSLARVAVTPSTASISPGSVHTFTALAFEANGTPITSGVTFNWSTPPAPLGTLNRTSGATVSFTAASPPVNGTLYVNGTYFGATKEGVAVLTVTSPASSSSSPSSSGMPLGEVAGIVAVAVIVSVAATVLVMRSLGKRHGPASGGSGPPT